MQLVRPAFGFVCALQVPVGPLGGLGLEGHSGGLGLGVELVGGPVILTARACTVMFSLCTHSHTSWRESKPGMQHLATHALVDTGARTPECPRNYGSVPCARRGEILKGYPSKSELSLQCA